MWLLGDEMLFPQKSFQSRFDNGELGFTSLLFKTASESSKTKFPSYDFIKQTVDTMEMIHQHRTSLLGGENKIFLIPSNLLYQLSPEKYQQDT